MPAAAVTPAPIAYIKVVAVKKLVVGCDGRSGCLVTEAAADVPAFSSAELGARCQSRVLSA